MWIALIIALIIGAILLLPVHIVVKNDEGEFKFLIKILFFTFGGKKEAKQKKKDNIVTHAIKKALGIDTVKKAQKEQSKQKQGLDFALGDIFRIVGNLLKELKQKRNLTILFISHDMNVIKYLSDRVGIMYYGSLIEENYTSTIFKYPKEDYTKKLLNAVPILKNM